jgi:hypothetical protein
MRSRSVHDGALRGHDGVVEMFHKQPVSGAHQSSAIVTISLPRPIARSVGHAAARRTHHPEDHHDRPV